MVGDPRFRDVSGILETSRFCVEWGIIKKKSVVGAMRK